MASQWYFSMKLHIGLDSHSGLVHSAVVTTAHVHDKHSPPQRPHGDAEREVGNNAHRRQKKLIGATPDISPVSSSR